MRIKNATPENYSTMPEERSRWDRTYPVFARTSRHLGGHVSSLYGYNPTPAYQQDDPGCASFMQFDDLRKTAMSGAASIVIGMGDMRGATAHVFLFMVPAPT